MRSLLPISLSLLLLSGRPAGAQLAPAADFFNSGAQLYISNNVPAALERVESGLKTYPDDDKLKKLEQLLKQQQQSQQNQQQQQQQNQKNQSQPQKQDQQKNQQQQNQQSPQKDSPDQQKPDEQKQSQAKKDAEQKQQDQQKAAAQKKDDEKSDKPEAEAQPVKAGQMTPEEAKRLLDAQKGDEQLLQLKPPEKPRNNSRPVKDW